MRYFLFVLFLICLHAPLCAQPKAPAVKLLTVSTHNFGTYPEREAKSCVFIVKNTGNAPLVFLKVETSCGCTTVKFSRRTVMPGQKGYIRAIYDGNGFVVGIYRKQIYVYTNADPQPLKLEISGTYFPKDE